MVPRTTAVSSLRPILSSTLASVYLVFLLLPLSNHFLRPRQHIGRDRHAELLGGNQIKRQLDVIDGVDSQLGRRRAIEHALDILGRAPADLEIALAVARHCAAR